MSDTAESCAMYHNSTPRVRVGCLVIVMNIVGLSIDPDSLVAFIPMHCDLTFVERIAKTSLPA